MDIVSQKKALRESARAGRRELAAHCPDFSERIATYADDLPITSPADVSGYRAVVEEADPSGLIATLQARGCEISYPRVHQKAQPLWFHVPIADEPWLTGAFGIPEPRSTWPRAFPTVLLVPLLAFDSTGYRLGYGGGYYDRTLVQLRKQHAVTAIGVAFAGQEVASVPHDAGDQRIDMVVTELGVRRFITG
jgi:5-formyltetrahydrofolate cyclo-ligase